MDQLYTVQINSTLQQLKWDHAQVAHLEKHLTGDNKAYIESQLDSIKARIAKAQEGPQVYSYHSGGKGNGAVGGLYTKKQLNRILGRYPEGIAKALPVAIGFTQADADENESEAEILGKAREWGVDNWEGWGEWNTEEDAE